MEADFEPPIFDEAAFQAEQAERDRAASHGNTVAFLIAELEDAAGSKDAPQAGSFALATIQRHALKRNRQPLSPVERDQLLLALMQARENMLQQVAGLDSNRYAFALSAHEAACALVVLWAEEDPHHSRPRDFITELNDRCRWFRNSLHNLALEQQLHRRRAPRRVHQAEVVKQLALVARHA